MNPKAPIIIIGCGRSGSTLLDRVLNSHPDIHMLGETNFLVARMWELLRHSSDGSQWTAGDRRAHQNRHLFGREDGEKVRAMASDSEWAGSEDARLASIVRQTVFDLFSLASIEKTHWGMKEIWNGGSETLDWAIYDAVFPDAIWVHLLRHPLGYVRSALGWNAMENSPDNVRGQIETWGRIVSKARERKSARRYVEIRYEDLLDNPRDVLGPVLGMVGLEWNIHCFRPIRQNWVATKHLPSVDPGSFQQTLEALGLSNLLASFGYATAEAVPQCPTTYSKIVERDEAGRIVISNGIRKGVGPYWIFELSTAPAIRDVLAEGDPSSLSLASFRLFENGMPMTRWEDPSNFFLSPPGCFFSNEGAVFFTTADGTDPVTNGRRYSICPA